MKKSDSLIAAICPQCGANIELSKNLRVGYCSFCGTKILIKEVLKNLNNPTFENYVTLGDRAYNDKNYEDALEYYSSALKINPNDWYVVYREGLSKSADEDVEYFDLKSGLDGCKHAIKIIDSDKELDALENSSRKVEILKDSFLIFNSYFNRIQQCVWNVTDTKYVESFLKLRKAFYYLLEHILTDELIESFSINSDKRNYINGSKIAILKKIILIDCGICTFKIKNTLRKNCIRDYNLCLMKLLEMNSNEEVPMIRKRNPLTQEQKILLFSIILCIGYILLILCVVSNYR